MPPVEYPFDVALSAMFELPCEVARELLPEHPEPIEVVHGQAALAVTVFNFTTSPVGPYRELALAVLVAPRVDREHVVPHAAFHTFLLAATTQVARQHAIDLWHLPHYLADVDIQVDAPPEASTASARVTDAEGRPVLALQVTRAQPFRAARRRYESFQRDASGLHVGTFEIHGELAESEDGGGALEVWDHPLHARPLALRASRSPLVTAWVRDGMESYLSIEGPYPDARAASTTRGARRTF